MGDWKNEEWLQRLKHKPVRFWIRDEIEEIIKEENIDRKRFHEVSKFEYENIIRKFWYSFFDYRKKPKIELNYAYIHLHKRLRYSKEIYWRDDWSEYISNIRTLLPDRNDDERYYLILNQGWVYEGCVSEIISVLTETDGMLEDFYIVSKKYDRMIVYSDDGQSMVAAESE